MTDEVPGPPEGFIHSNLRSAFNLHNGPLFVRPDSPASEHCFPLLPRHANIMGFAHGGMLSSFLDVVMAEAVRNATDRAVVTMHLSIDFLNMGRVGEWVHGTAEVTRATRDVAFVEARIFVGARDLVRGSGVFKLMNKR